MLKALQYKGEVRIVCTTHLEIGAMIVTHGDTDYFASLTAIYESENRPDERKRPLYELREHLIKNTKARSSEVRSR